MRVPSEQPALTFCQHLRQQYRDRLRILHSIIGSGVPLSHLHPDVGTGKVGEHALIREVIADEQHGGRTEAMTQKCDGFGLVRLHDTQLEHPLAVSHPHALEPTDGVLDPG